MSETWTEVKSKPQKRDSERTVFKPLSEDEVISFLSFFKVNPCHTEEFHDHRLCESHHSDKDRRRNPYKAFYDVTECTNTLETMYHPEIFRTTLCDRKTECVFGSKRCAHAHSMSDLRDRVEASLRYKTGAVAAEHRERPTIASFIPDSPRKDFRALCSGRWEEMRVYPTTKFLELDPVKWFVLQKSQSLRRDIEEVAFENGLGTVFPTTCSNGRNGVVLKGVDVDTIEACVFSLFYLRKYFALEEREYGDRVVSSLRAIIADKDACFQLSGSSKVLIQVVNERSIRVIGVSDANDSKTNGEALVQDVFQKIDFWVNQEGYAKFTKCRCCFEKRNQDQGVTCENNHFYCSVDGCLDGAIRAQLTNLASRKCLLCPECPATYDIQTIASHVTHAVWDDVQKALIDREVKLQHEVLAREFDERLEMKVQELIQNYGAADLDLKFKAQKEALVIRNSILNLACPHCQTAYFEFTGCMALQCECCKKNFCGYCHQGFSTGSGTHEHVRNCVLNETANGSYYANEAEVKIAQRRYRTRKLRRHLQGFKKDLQNAVVIELGKELDDLGIKPAALFDFGNLQQG